ncbi:right-handed parallel beta-helix repeat-containing protein [Gynuella sp.]|uniref:right-handed parallel beta-helix repeat-containing protein n=1 Tax=Gynuella sp. TaxID=2969146 RepID=UPI003D0C1CD2
MKIDFQILKVFRTSIKILLVGFFLYGHAEAVEMNVSWESQFNLPPQDEAGWSILKPSTDSRLIYVSIVNGNDLDAKVYSKADPEIGEDYQNPKGPIKPFGSLSAAMAQLRDGFPDYLLFNRGETFVKPEGFPLDIKAGRSVSERQVVTSYGPVEKDRPEIDTGIGWGFNFNRAPYSALVGIRVVASKRNPDKDGNGVVDPDFDWDTINQALGFRGLDVVGHILIEDCWFDWYSSNYFQSTDDSKEVIDIVIRRNLITNNYSTGGQHPQGIYSDNVSSLIEENVFDHNGWYQQGTGSNDEEGRATYFNHNMYFVEPRNTIIRNNFFLRSSSIGSKFTSNTTSGVNQVKSWNLLVDNNLYLEGEVGIGLSGNKDQNNGPRFREIYVTNNVILSMGTTQPTGRDLGWGLDIADWESGLVENNIFAHWGKYDSQNNNNYAIDVVGHVTDTVIRNNIIYDIYSNQVLVRFTDYEDITSFTFEGNEIQGKNADTQRPGRMLQYSVSPGVGLLKDNYYYSEMPQDSWFSGQGEATLSLDAYRTYTKDSTSKAVLRQYYSPERTVKTYLSDVMQSSNTSTEYLVSLLKKQSKRSWNKFLTTDYINTYIRGGFCTDGAVLCDDSNVFNLSKPVPPAGLKVIK